MGVNNVLSGQTKKKQVGRQVREREKRERDGERKSDNHLPKHDTCFHLRK